MNRKKKKAQPEEKKTSKRGMTAFLQGRIKSDVLGSYTGIPAEEEEPVQDADDL